MSKLLNLKQKDKNNKERTVGKIELRNQINETQQEQELYFYGDIISDSWFKWCDEDKCPQDVADILRDIDETKDLHVYINSGGGSVYAGIAIYNQLKRKKCNKIVHVDGLAASIASVIMLSGDRVIIPTGAQTMIHDPLQSLWGGYNSKELRKLADDLDKTKETILNIYGANLKDGIDIEEIRTLMDNETWLTGEEAAEYFNIEVEEGGQQVACASSYYEKYRNKPNSLIIKNDNKKINNILKDKLQIELELLSL